MPNESSWSPTEWFASAGRGSTAAETPSEPVRTIDELAEIAVASIEKLQTDGDAAVQVKINDDVMPGVEIELHHSNGGLKISVRASDAGSFELLNDSAGSLVERLNEKLHQAVTVEIHLNASSATLDHAPDRNFDEKDRPRDHGSQSGDDSKRRRGGQASQEDSEESQR